MAETKRYECVMLGHNEPLIQTKLDKIGSDSRVVGVVSIGVNVLAIVERDKPWQPPPPLPPAANKRVKL